MRVRRPRNGEEIGGSDWIDVATGRVGKIAALVGAIGGLVLLVLNYTAGIQKGVRDISKGKSAVVDRKEDSAAQCLEISRFVIPETVKYSEWDNMLINVEGRNDCDEPHGLYVTFLRRNAGSASFLLRIPYEDKTDCSGTKAVLVPSCWDSLSPIKKGEWTEKILPPHLDSLSDSWSAETIFVKCEVRNYDEPERPPMAARTAEILVTNDKEQP